ncbi:N/A [soil metagenome]
MQIIRKTIFNPTNVEFADFMKILAHPARLDILKIIAVKNSCSCGDIVNLLSYSQSTVSQHLKDLREGGLINLTQSGPKSIYSINWEVISNKFLLFYDYSKEILELNPS